MIVITHASGEDDSTGQEIMKVCIRSVLSNKMIAIVHVLNNVLAFTAVMLHINSEGDVMTSRKPKILVYDYSRSIIVREPAVKNLMMA